MLSLNRESLLINDLKNPDLKDKAFNDLLDKYQEGLYWHIRKIVISHDNANDVLQNTFIRIYKGIHKFEGKSKLQTWMYRIAYNESLRFLEKNKRNLSQSMNDDSSYLVENLTEDVYFNGEEIQVKLQEIISKFSNKQRLVFQMKYFDALSFKQISKILQISENTLKSSYYSAVKIIEEKIVL